MNDRVEKRRFNNRGNCLVDLVKEIRTESWQARIVELGGFGRLTNRLGMISHSHPNDFRACDMASVCAIPSTAPLLR